MQPMTLTPTFVPAWSLIMSVLVGVVLLAALVTLLWHRPTRVVGGVLLTILAALLIAVVPGYLLLHGSGVPHDMAQQSFPPDPFSGFQHAAPEVAAKFTISVGIFVVFFVAFFVVAFLAAMALVRGGWRTVLTLVPAVLAVGLLGFVTLRVSHKSHIHQQQFAEANSEILLEQLTHNLDQMVGDSGLMIPPPISVTAEPLPDSAAETDNVPPAQPESPAEPESTAAETDPPQSPADEHHGDLPDWVLQPPKQVGEVYQQVVKVGPYSTLQECQSHSGRLLLDAVREFTQQITGISTSPGQLAPLEFIRSEVVADRYQEQRDFDIQPGMWSEYLLLKFTPSVSNQLRLAAANIHRQQAIVEVGKWCGGVLGLLGCVLGALRLDSATRGYYSRPLFVGTVVVILGVLLSLVA